MQKKMTIQQSQLLNNFSDVNLNNNINPNTIPPNLQNIYNLQYGGMIPPSSQIPPQDFTSNQQGINNGGGFPNITNPLLQANTYQDSMTKNLMYQNYLLQQNIARNNLIQRYLITNGLQNNSLIIQAAYGQGYNQQIMRPTLPLTNLNTNAFINPFNQGTNILNPMSNMVLNNGSQQNFPGF